MATEPTHPDPRWYDTMAGLLYPAVLGALLYTFADHAVRGTVAFGALASWNAIALLALFAADFLHTVELKADYEAADFACDLVIVAVLFLAGNRLWNADWQQLGGLLALPLWAWLTAAKAAAMAFEYRRADRRGSRFNFVTDLMLLLAYPVLGLSAADWLFVALLADAAFYLVPQDMLDRWLARLGFGVAR